MPLSSNFEGPGWLNELGSWITYRLIQAYDNTAWVRTRLCKLQLEAQWAEPVSLTFHSALRKLNTEPPIGASHQILVIWLSSYREEDI